MPTQRVPIILDTDTFNEIDDQFALIYTLIAKDKMEVRGVTAAPFFNDRSSSPEDGMLKSYNEIKLILELMGESDTPVKYGSRKYLKSRETPVESEAIDFIISESKTVAQMGGKLTVIAIGAITNIASAIIKDPSLVERIKVVWLGGNDFQCPKYNEFNLYQDVAAAQVVLNSGVDLVLVPCQNVANSLDFTAEEISSHLAGTGKAGTYLKDIFVEYMTERNLQTKVIWDIAAVSYLTIPEATQWQEVQAPALADEGNWILNGNPHQITIAIKMDKDILFKDFISRFKNSLK